MEINKLVKDFEEYNGGKHT